MHNNNYEVRQAVKACLINYLEDRYQQEVEQAYFAAQVSEEVTLLTILKEKYPLLRGILQNAIEEELNKVTFGVPQDNRWLSKEQEELIDTVIDNATNTDIMLLVNDCKQLLSI